MKGLRAPPLSSSGIHTEHGPIPQSMPQSKGGPCTGRTRIWWWEFDSRRRSRGASCPRPHLWRRSLAVLIGGQKKQTPTSLVTGPARHCAPRMHTRCPPDFDHQRLSHVHRWWAKAGLGRSTVATQPRPTRQALDYARARHEDGQRRGVRELGLQAVQDRGRAQQRRRSGRWTGAGGRPAAATNVPCDRNFLGERAIR